MVSERNCDALRSFSIWLADRDPWCRRLVRVSEAADFGYDSNLPGRCAVGLTRWSRSHGNEMLYECESRESQKEWNLRERVLVFGFWILNLFIFYFYDGFLFLLMGKYPLGNFGDSNFGLPGASITLLSRLLKMEKPHKWARPGQQCSFSAPQGDH